MRRIADSASAVSRGLRAAVVAFVGALEVGGTAFVWFVEGEGDG